MSTNYSAGDAGQPREGQEHIDNDEGEAEGGEQGAGGDEVEPRGAAAEIQPGESSGSTNPRTRLLIIQKI